MLAILQRVTEQAVVEQIHIILKKVAERFPYVSEVYKNATDFAEDLLYRTEAYKAGEVQTEKPASGRHGNTEKLRPGVWRLSGSG